MTMRRIETRGELDGEPVEIVSVSTDREMIDVNTALKAWKADTKWEYTDKAGHLHRWYGNKIPTTDTVEETYWCDGCHDEHTQTKFVCRWCPETITPEYKTVIGPQWVPGLESAIAKLRGATGRPGDIKFITTDDVAFEAVCASVEIGWDLMPLSEWSSVGEIFHRQETR